MATPNLLALVTVNIATATLAATASEQDLFDAVATGKAVAVDAIYCANSHATATGWVTVVYRKALVDYTITFQQRIQVKTTINVLLGRPLYLEEGDSVKVTANAVSNVHVTAPYSIMNV